MGAVDCIGFGVSKQTGKLVDVENVPRGKACDCACSTCGGDLISRQGQLRAWHFAHESGSPDCVGAAESALHRAAKELVASWRAIELPSLTVTESIPGQFETLTDTATIPKKSLIIEFGAAEVDLKSFRPDVMLYAASHECVAVEIYVSHAVDDVKGDRVKDAGQAMIEFDLSKMPKFGLTKSELDQALRKMAAKWIHHPEEEQAKITLRKKLYERKAAEFASRKRQQLAERNGRGRHWGDYEPPAKESILLATVEYMGVELRLKTHPLLEGVTVWACYGTPSLRHQALMHIAQAARSNDQSCTSSSASIGYINVWGAEARAWATSYASPGTLSRNEASGT